jgi:L-fuculose-phosphate aldolase
LSTSTNKGNSGTQYLFALAIKYCVPEFQEFWRRIMDLSKLTVITELDLAEAVRAGTGEIQVSENALLTLSACEYARENSVKLSPCRTNVEESEESALKLEIVRAGRKRWERHYVDGSGGNISARLDDQRIICTPSLCCKGDLTINDFAVVDMDGRQIHGTKPRSSEILLHLEIYRAVPQAQAVIHCHPPHALAYAVTGLLPKGHMVPEHEVFIGDVALAPYETPGTAEFARSVAPLVQDRNMILLQNHGVVCWADTATHAEWMVEVFDAYCRTLILASTLNAELTPIPEAKVAELKEIRKKLNL